MWVCLSAESVHEAAHPERTEALSICASGRLRDPRNSFLSPHQGRRDRQRRRADAVIPDLGGTLVGSFGLRGLAVMGGRSFEHQRSLSERLMEEPGPLASPERTACAAGLDAVPHLLGALHALGPSGGLPDAELVDSTPSFLVRSIRGEPAMYHFTYPCTRGMLDGRADPSFATLSVYPAAPGERHGGF
jgi:hypothetical protein